MSGPGAGQAEHAPGTLYLGGTPIGNVEDLSPRALRILGAVSVVEARGIRLQNAAWADGGDMLSVGHLQLSVDLRSLFTETPVIPSLLLEDCDLLFARDATAPATGS